MVVRTQINGAVKEDLEGSTVSEMITSLKSAFRNASFTRVEEALVSREEKLKDEIKEKNGENQALLEKLHRFQKEFEELREEREGLLKRVKENEGDKREISELKRKIFDLESANFNSNAGKTKVSEEVESGLNVVEETGKFDSDVKMLSETKQNPSGGPSHRKRTDNRKPVPEDIVEIIDSDNESASPKTARWIVTDGHLHKADSAQNVTENHPTVCKRNSVDVDDSCPSEKGKGVKVEESVPFASTVEHHSPAALNLGTHYAGKGIMSSDLSKVLSEIGGDSSSSYSSDDEVDVSLIGQIKTLDGGFKNLAPQG